MRASTFLLLSLLGVLASHGKPVEFVVEVTTSPEWANGPARSPLSLHCTIDSEQPTTLELGPEPGIDLTITAVGASSGGGRRDLYRQIYLLTLQAPLPEPFGREVPLVLRDHGGTERLRFALAVVREGGVIYASTADLESLRREARARSRRNTGAFQYEDDPEVRHDAVRRGRPEFKPAFHDASHGGVLAQAEGL